MRRSDPPSVYPLIVVTLLVVIWVIGIGQNFCYAQTFSSRNQIDLALFRKHLYFLGDDSLEGRGTGTRGELKAAEYIARHLSGFNLRVVGDQNSYFQFIPMHGSRARNESSLQIFSGNQTYSLNLNQEYLLFKSGEQTYIPNPVPLVFVGYGITAPEFDYNDYQNVNVQGKIVVFLSGEPFSEDSTFFNGSQATIYSAPEAKQRIALSHGAKGSIIIPNPRLEQTEQWKNWIREFSFEDVTMAYTASWHLSILINPASAQLLFRDAPYSLQDILGFDYSGTMRSFELKSTLKFEGRFTERDFLARNVLAMLEGTRRDESATFLLLTAHYDHLGIGPPVGGDSIYNGVFDNAAGVAVLLEIARIFSQAKERLPASLIFLFTTGEEKGLLGSTYYVDHPPLPLGRTTANINIDGISLFDEFTSVIAPGIHYSNLDDALKKVLDSKDMKLSAFPDETFLEFESVLRSDQCSFAKAGVPFAMLLEGLTYKTGRTEDGIERQVNWYRTIYHTPGDDLHQPINYTAARQHIQLLVDFIHYLAAGEIEIKWRPGAPFNAARLRSIAEKR